MSFERAALGRTGERRAALYLTEAGYELLHQNWRIAGGEIDLLARDPADRTIVVVEVKTRTSAELACPADNITAAKRQTLARLAHSVADRYPESNVRVDAIEVCGPTVNHLRDILN